MSADEFTALSAKLTADELALCMRLVRAMLLIPGFSAAYKAAIPPGEDGLAPAALQAMLDKWERAPVGTAIKDRWSPMAALVHSSGPALQLLGGERVLAGLEQRTAELRLPACPFCGSGAQVCFETDGAQLCAATRCSRCGASTQTVKGTAAGALLAACALRWSRRE